MGLGFSKGIAHISFALALGAIASQAMANGPLGIVFETDHDATNIGVSPTISTAEALNWNAQVLGRLKASGVKPDSVRIWQAIKNWGADWQLDALRAQVALAKDTYQVPTVLIAIVPDAGLAGSISDTNVTNRVNAVLNAVGSKIDLIELGNEQDTPYYWPGSSSLISTYVNSFVRPAHDAIQAYNSAHGRSIKIMSGGTYNYGAITTQLKAGIMKYVDFLGLHPYATTVGGVQSALGRTGALATALQNAGCPASVSISSGDSSHPCYANPAKFTATEWHIKEFNVGGNCNFGSNAAANRLTRATDNLKVYSTIKSSFAYAYFFSGGVDRTQQAGCFGLVNYTSGGAGGGSKNTPSFESYLAMAGVTAPWCALNPSYSGCSKTSTSAKLGAISLYNTTKQLEITPTVSGNTLTVDAAQVRRNQSVFTHIALGVDKGTFDSVSFVFDGHSSTAHTETGAAPYTSFGEDSSIIMGKAFAMPAGQNSVTHTFAVTPYLAGVAGATVTYTVVIKDSDVEVATPTMTATGIVFGDANKNSAKDGTEAGLPGIKVYLDKNGNNSADADEPSTMTSSTGSYSLSFAETTDTSYRVRAVIPTGASQVSPANNYGFAIAGSNARLSGESFGFYGVKSGSPTTGGDSKTASISGLLWNDGNANGKRDSNEAVSGVRQVYIDANGNGRYDSGEITVNSDASGNYKLSGLAAGSYKVTRVYPTGYYMSNSSTGYLLVSVAAGQAVSGKDLGSAQK